LLWQVFIALREKSSKEFNELMPTPATTPI
jgi:hypothetical protein